MKRKFSKQLRRQRRSSALASQTLSRVGFCIETNAMRSSNNTSSVCVCIAAAAAACCSSLYCLPTELAQTSSAPQQVAGSIEYHLCMDCFVLRGLSSSPMKHLLSLMTNMKKQNQRYILQLSLSNLHKHLGAALALCCCCYNNCKHTYRTHSTYTVKRVHTQTHTAAQSRVTGGRRRRACCA